ncbi:pyridoxal-phosphate dependent enzyme [Kitasatospora sp. NPDC093806]|uniref:pyridoxal-phosphate dependent enzyme n=1 Tax=Kitasatospora sp. NPDC093806 TaxID=3155075 RepID=UPI00343A92D0
MSQIDDVLGERIRRTPLLTAEVEFRKSVRRFALKLEQNGRTGSVKDRTAVGLLRRLHSERPLLPGTVVIESTSGNLGLALAGILGALDCRFIAVIDPKTPRTTREALLHSGAEVILVDESDGRGGYLLSRLETVARLCAENPDYRWPDQYGNPASPDIHESTTGPEIVEQAGPALDAVYVPVSTGGTFAGIAAHLHKVRPDVAAVAVDLDGSVALGGDAGDRLLPGIGASRPSSFVRPGDYDRAVRVDGCEAIAVCRIVLEDLGLALGGSSGCTVRALLADLGRGLTTRLAVCLAADGGGKYLDTVYSDDWARRTGIHEDIELAGKRLRHEGLRFRWAQ